MRVVVCDDSALFRRRMIVGLEVERDVEVLAECDDAEQSIGVVRDLAPDVVFIGMQISQIGGVRTTAGIREVVPNCKVIIVLSTQELGDAIRALRAGAVGFSTRDDAVPRAALSTRQVMAEQVILPPVVAGQVLAEFDGLARRAGPAPHQLEPPALAERERFALEQLRDAIPVEQTAEQLQVSASTVHNLAASAVFKLHRHARSEAVLYTVADKVY